MFAGLTPAGPYYSASQRDAVVPFQAGVQPQPTPPYESTAVRTSEVSLTGRSPASDFYAAGNFGPQAYAVGQQPVSRPPYVSTLALSDILSVPGLSGTANPQRIDAINGLKSSSSCFFAGLVITPSVLQPGARFDLFTFAALL